MEDLLKSGAGAIALGVEGIAALIIAFGAVEAVWLLASKPHPGFGQIGHRRAVWIRFAGWLVLALEFELAADILRTSITPTWQDLGQLGAIAVIRTFLNYFLTKDMKEANPARELDQHSTEAVRG